MVNPYLRGNFIEKLSIAQFNYIEIFVDFKSNFPVFQKKIYVQLEVNNRLKEIL